MSFQARSGEVYSQQQVQQLVNAHAASVRRGDIAAEVHSGEQPPSLSKLRSALNEQQVVTGAPLSIHLPLSTTETLQAFTDPDPRAGEGGNFEVHDYRPNAASSDPRDNPCFGPKVTKVASETTDHSVPEGFAAQVIKTVRERGNAYGSPAENHQTTADLLSSWFSRRFKQPLVLTAEDVIVINVIQKVSRLANVSKDDSWLDIAGYTENVAMIRPDQRNGATDAKRNDLVGKTYNVTLDLNRCDVNGFALNKGDVVRLIGSSKELTVSVIGTSEVHCQWFDGAQLQSGSFFSSGLEFVRRN